ncbi:hypothetical protein J6G99_06245 [bacterium]|nr:hypothetical protein [bacterium]
MPNLIIQNKILENSVFKNVYNFPIRNNTFWANSSVINNLNIDNDKNKIKYGNLGLLVFVGSLSFFSKGIQKKSKNMLVNFKEYLSLKQSKYFFEQNNKKFPFYEYAIRKINSFIKKTESVNNINSIKDMLFMRLMYKSSITKSIHKGISDFFEYLSRNTVIKSYKNTQKCFDNMYACFDKLDEYILKNSGDEIVEYGSDKFSKKELIKQARNNRSMVRMVVDSFIAKPAQEARYQYIKESTSVLYSGIWDASFKDFWTKDNKFKRKEMWQTFIAAEQIKLNKTDLTNKVAFARNMLSYTDAEKKSYISTYIDNLNSMIPANDAYGAKIINRLKWFIKDDAPLTKNTNNFLKELDLLETHELNKGLKEEIVKDQLHDKKINIRQIRDLIKEDAPGDIEKMLDIYRTIAPIELSKSGSLKSLKDAINSFDKSIKLEVGEFFDKLRDLEIGSASTDVLTILCSSALIVNALEKAKNKEDRISILLNSGIPIAGATVVTLISAAKLVSGSKSLILGFVSGIVLNILGKNIDIYQKKITAKYLKHNSNL